MLYIKETKRLWPSLLLSCVVTFLFYQYGGAISDKSIQAVASVVSGIASTLLGFLVTAIALMASLGDAELIKNMKGYGKYVTLLNGAFYNCTMLLLLIICCISCLFTDGKLLNVLFLFTVFIFSHSVYCSVDSGKRFYNILVVLQ